MYIFISCKHTRLHNVNKIRVSNAMLNKSLYFYTDIMIHQSFIVYIHLMIIASIYYPFYIKASYNLVGKPYEKCFLLKASISITSSCICDWSNDGDDRNNDGGDRNILGDDRNNDGGDRNKHGGDRKNACDGIDKVNVFLDLD